MVFNDINYFDFADMTSWKHFDAYKKWLANCKNTKV